MVDNLETKSRKAILNIKEKVSDIDNVLRDLSMKLCHIIKYKNNHYDKYDSTVDHYNGS